MLINLFIIFIYYRLLIEPFIPTFFSDISFSWLFFYALLLIFPFKFTIKPDFRIFNRWIVILIVYYLVVILSVLWAPQYSYDLFTLKRLFARNIAPLLIAVIAFYLFTEKDNVHLYIKHTCIVSVVISMIGIFQMIVGSSVIYGDVRSTGTFENPNGLAIFLVLTLPCLIYGIESKIVSRKWGWLATAIVIGGIISTVSRKGIITAVIAFFIYYMLKKQFKKIIKLVAAIAIFAVIFSGYIVISHRFTQEKMIHDIIGKTNMAYVGLEMFTEHPIIGLGYNGYFENFGKYFPKSYVLKYDCHNEFVTALANFGLLGFIPFMGIFIYPLVFSVKILCQKGTMLNKEHSRDMAVICISSVVPFMLSAYFAGGLFAQWPLIFILYTNIALVLAAKNWQSFKVSSNIIE